MRDAPNPAAERDYIKRFGLGRCEFRLVREELAPEQHRFLVKQGLASVVVELDLGASTTSRRPSGRGETVVLLDRLRASLGEDLALWMAATGAAMRR
jgi:type IV secretion system protein VirB4